MILTFAVFFFTQPLLFNNNSFNFSDKSIKFSGKKHYGHQKLTEDNRKKVVGATGPIRWERSRKEICNGVDENSDEMVLKKNSSYLFEWPRQ